MSQTLGDNGIGESLVSGLVHLDSTVLLLLAEILVQRCEARAGLEPASFFEQAMTLCHSSSQYGSPFSDGCSDKASLALDPKVKPEAPFGCLKVARSGRAWLQYARAG